MTQPGTPGGQIPVNDLDGLARRLRDMERDIAALRANALGVNGIVIGDRGSLRTADFDGTDFAHPGTMGVYLASEAGVGKLVVNDILLRGGIVGNDALANPVAFGAYGGSSVGWAVSTTAAAVKSGTIAVPSGYTRALVMCNAHASATNTSASYDFLYTSARIDASGGGPLFNLAAPGSQTYSGSSAIRTLTGLAPASSITVACQVNSSVGNWTAAGSNAATVDAIAVFLR